MSAASVTGTRYRRLSRLVGCSLFVFKSVVNHWNQCRCQDCQNEGHDCAFDHVTLAKDDKGQNIEQHGESPSDGCKDRYLDNEKKGNGKNDGRSQDARPDRPFFILILHS